MSASGVFSAVVKPSLDRVPAVEIRHTESHAGREVVLSHMVRRNVFTEFDMRLSRHLAALTGLGFPEVSVATRWRAHGTSEPWRNLEESDFPTVLHALDVIARRALEGRETAVLRLHHHDLSQGERSREGERRVISRDDVKGLERALEVCALFGEAPFLSVGGDFDLVVAEVPGAGLPALSIDLATGRILVPESDGFAALTGALYDTDHIFNSDSAGRVYMAAMRRGVLAAKQDAVLDFRAAAERRILEFDDALKGRALSGHRLETAASLVARLKAGLGDSLAGLSENAQLTAFDWQAEMEGDAGRAGNAVWRAGDDRGESPARAYA